MSEEPGDNDVGKETEHPESDAIIDKVIEDTVDRDRGIFTRSDREFLLGQKEYEHRQSSINKRHDIRDRLYHGLLDLQLLNRIQPSERIKLFSTINLGELHESVAELIALIYGGLDGDIEAIEQMVQSGIYKAEQGGIEGYRGGARNVEVNIDVTFEYDVDEIYKRFKRGDGSNLTPAEIGVLVRDGRLKPDDYDKLSWDEDERPRNTPAASINPWYRKYRDK